MIKKIVLSLLLLGLWACQTTITETTEEITKAFLKEKKLDKRTSYLDVRIENGKLVGVAQNKELANNFADFVNKDRKKLFTNEIKIAPQNIAYIRNSVSNARSNPKHSAELATQYLMGQQVNILKTNGDWLYIQGPDNYLAWIDAGGIISKEKTSKKWLNAPKEIVQINEYTALENIDDYKIATDLVFGNILGKIAPNTYITPAGDVLYITDKTVFQQPTNQDNITKVLNRAYSLMGRPYLWGGTSTKGIDCSGFTRTAFMNADYLLGRDASLQVHEGEEVDKDNMNDWAVGDLLFFGTLREDGSQRITHVAIHTGNGDMIHASQRVREESLNPNSPIYNKDRANTLLRVKRIFN